MRYLVANRMFMISAWNKLIKRNVLINNKIMFELGHLCEDLDWNLNLISCLNSVVVVSDDFYVYRMREGSITNTKTENNVRHWLKTMTKWTRIISSPEVPPERRELCSIFLADAYLTMIYLYALLSEASKKELSGQIKLLDNLLQYKINPRVKKIAWMYPVLRLNGTSRVLYCFIHLKAWLNK
jgi:hypothetical protein